MMKDYQNMLRSYEEEIGKLFGEAKEKRIRDIGC